MFDLKSTKIAVIGLGYVGLPLAVEFGKQYKTIAYDVNDKRINELKSGLDKTNEVDSKELEDSQYIQFTSEKEKLIEANVYIVTVPTPIDENHQPDLTPLKNASRTIGEVISKGDVVIYESTVYPGATEEDCVPVIEQVSEFKYNVDFFAAYSPERINPGDKKHTIKTITKVTSGSTPEVADYVDKLYQTIIPVGTHKAPSIKVAEAAKVIENTQRDLNIALVNELAMIFNRLGIDTQDVLDAAATKWNFLQFKPGLVGGHCIGIDPYYLTYKAESSGYHPDVILAGRKINDGMGKYIVSRLVKEMIKKRIHVSDSNILIMGFAFKENCADIRNTKVIDIYNELLDYNAKVDIFDPVIDSQVMMDTYQLSLLNKIDKNSYDAVVVSVAHQQFISIGIEKIKSYLKEGGLIYDIKGLFNSNNTDVRL